MMDMRRHSVSVDAPLSRTLVQLKRVRSLRDPATNSMSKYASPSDHMIWETASSNGVTPELGRSAHHHLVGEDEDVGAEPTTMGSERSFRGPSARTASYRKSSAVRIRGLNPPRSKQVHRVRQDGHRKSLDSNHSNHSSIRQLADNMVSNVDADKEEGEVNSYERPKLAMPDKSDEEVKMPGCSKSRSKSSAAMSRVGSPCMLERICIEEGLEFDHDGLYFIAAKSNGSLRDSEIMLDQLSLLGKKVTISLVHELVGSVSDDELIELLDLALSSDTTNTVRRARELMGSAIDPLQLVSQLANLIMDILSGRCQSAVTEVSKSFLGRYALSEVGIKKLRHALKILSETEKQLRTSRNQATWVTVALLQFSTNEPNPVAETNDMHAHSVTGYTDDWVSKVHSSANFCQACNSSKSNCSERHCRRLKLENIWRRAIGKCRSRSAKSFLRKEGFLSSVHVTEELAIAEVGFEHPDHLSRAEKMQSLIESSLQHVLGCNVEIRFKLVPCPVSKDARLKRQPFSFLNCSGRKQELSDSVVTDEDEAARGPGARETPLKGYTSSQQESPYTMRRVDSKPTTVHGCEDDARSTLTSSRSTADDLTRTCRSETGYPKGVREQGRSDGTQQEPDLQPNCFSRTLKLQKKLLSSGAAHTICLRVQPHNKMDFLPKKEFDTYFCAYEPYEQCPRSDSRATYSSRDDDLKERVNWVEQIDSATRFYQFCPKLETWTPPAAAGTNFEGKSRRGLCYS
ncbi:Protein STICHEL-like 2 [Zea mays]|uniref:Protein STICHEL-like 2 n=1 Tax=Zea mays TaxID=4577 RepID=A0A1D6E841_MAIZE|nr:Protein STICHEL-like 2 [Zea mays]